MRGTKQDKSCTWWRSPHSGQLVMFMVWILFLFSLCLDTIPEWSCFCLPPSWSQSSLVRIYEVVYGQHIIDISVIDEMFYFFLYKVLELHCVFCVYTTPQFRPATLQMFMIHMCLLAPNLECTTMESCFIFSFIFFRLLLENVLCYTEVHKPQPAATEQKLSPAKPEIFALWLFAICRYLLLFSVLVFFFFFFY